jgi:pimeloyl-ACP methyl ester carboxylesterase
MTDEVLPNATRRVKLLFDQDGDPVYPGVKRPECFKPAALGVLPPRDVIPVIFVPGIAGTNLKRGKENTWAPPNSVLGGLSEAAKATMRSAKTRQRLFDPNDTEIKTDGECSISDKTYWLDSNEAQKRGWSTLHAMSYHAFLQQLETSLNDLGTLPGYPLGEEGNYLLPEIGMLQHLNGEPATGTKWDEPDYAKAVEKTTQAWGKALRSLSREEILRLDDYYYPVWAYGYNWLKDAEEAASGLSAYIDTVLAHYDKSVYFRHQGKVILVTHSMGGLIARRGAQLAPDKVLGVVHGVQPVVGASVLYRRLRAGQEIKHFFDIAGRAVAAIMGRNQEDMTVQLARCPGPFVLAPTKDYPPHWLRVYGGNKEDEGNLLFSLPESDPYTEIYAKTTEEVWWGMVDPGLMDPLGEMTGEGEKPTPKKAYGKAIEKAAMFHDKLGLYAHPETYGYYGIEEESSFGHVAWTCPAGVESYMDCYEDEACTRPLQRDYFKTAPGRGQQSGKAHVPVYRKASTAAYTAEESILHAKTLAGGEQRVSFKLPNTRNQAGDGTVPKDSGSFLEDLKPPLKEILGIPGFDHQAAFDNLHAYRATVYFIARIVQNAAPAKPC